MVWGSPTNLITHRTSASYFLSLSKCGDQPAQEQIIFEKYNENPS